MDALQKLKDFIAQSELGEDDKKLFSSFLDDLSEEEINDMYKSFEDNPALLPYFWQNTKSKIMAISAINSSESISEEQKTELIDDIISMNEDEFKLFLDSITAVLSSEDPQTALKQLSQEQEQAHEEFISQAKKFVEQLKQEHLVLQKDQDEDDYEDTLAKIKGL